MPTESMTQLRVLLANEQKMNAFGEEIAKAVTCVNRPLLIVLNGDLGAGKTTLLFIVPPPVA